MTSILELDMGNSRIKWRQLESESLKILKRGIVADIAELIQSLEQQPAPAGVRLCSVRAPALLADLQQWLQENWALQATVARVTRSCGGVSNRYADTASLGIDRWLAMLAGYRRATGACVIVDAGTALTVDALDTSGQHLGGYILPGLLLMTRAIEANTAIRLQQQAHGDSIALGHSTDEAVFNGTLAAVVALIARTLESVSNPQKPAKLYFSGGNAELVRDAGGFDDAEILPDLVLDGLQIACPD